MGKIKLIEIKGPQTVGKPEESRVTFRVETQGEIDIQARVAFQGLPLEG